MDNDVGQSVIELGSTSSCRAYTAVYVCYSVDQLSLYIGTFYEKNRSTFQLWLSNHYSSELSLAICKGTNVHITLALTHDIYTRRTIDFLSSLILLANLS